MSHTIVFSIPLATHSTRPSILRRYTLTGQNLHLILVHSRVLNINHRTLIACASAPKARPARPKPWTARPEPWTAWPPSLLLLLLLPLSLLLLLRLGKGAEEGVLLRLPLCLALPRLC